MSDATTNISIIEQSRDGKLSWYVLDGGYTIGGPFKTREEAEKRKIDLESIKKLQAKPLEYDDLEP